MGAFIKRFNNYSCIEKNDTTDISCLSHYTSNIQALSNICSGEFWATDINDFDDTRRYSYVLFDNAPRFHRYIDFAANK